jgi:long-chain acyl-CoA synthetase
MQTITRLFDILDNYVNQYPDKKMLFAKINREWQGLSSAEIKHQAMQLATSLLQLGINSKALHPEEKSMIGIISNNRPEWVIADFATQLCGAVLVPLYPSITDAEWAYILNESNTTILFVSDKMIYKKLLKVIDRLPNLQHVLCFDEIEGVQHWTSLLKPITESQIQEIETIKNSIGSSHLATIIYTSGTTGNPKGVMLSHQNIASNVSGSMSAFSFCDSNERTLSFLPLNHIFERTVLYIYMNKAVSIYFAEGMETIGPDLKDVKPVVFTTVPRLLEKVYEKIDAKGSELQGIKRKLFDWAVTLALRFDGHDKKSFIYSLQLSLADKLVYSKWREAIGGKVKAIVTGSAACQVKLLRLFGAANIIVMEGYGLTETSPVVSVNRYEQENRKFGTIGTLIDNVKVKLGDDGEIICQGPNVMMGYFKHPELTAEVLKDDWFYTGDIGELIEGKFLKITDRKKEIFKISGGKYVAPLPIENKMKESAFIEQLMIVGSNEKFVGALIVPAMEKIKEALKKLGIDYNTHFDFVNSKEVYKIIRTELDVYNKFFAAHEQVKKFKIVPNEWTIDSGELTATMKLKRKKIYEKYGDLITSIYA